MAKSRAQRKAEKRRRQRSQQQRQPGRPGEEPSRAQHETQTGQSGEVAEAEAVMQTGARTEDYGEHVADAPEEAQAPPEPAEAAPSLESIAPSRADAGRPGDGDAAAVEEAPAGESRDERRERKQREKEERRKQRAKELQKGAPAAEPQQKQRGAVTGFIASCWAELKKVQWPDRDTLVQASAVTIIFVFVAAAYLGALDALFNFIVKEILL